MEGFGAVLLVAFFIAMYFVPTGVAVFREHKQSLAIFLTNLLTGWTGIGWIIAIIWAATEDE